MGAISVSLPSDGTNADVSDYNTPLTTIVNDYNGNIDNSNISASAAISTSKLADDNGIGANKLSSSAITLGYAQITSNFTTSATSATFATGLTATVTIPTGSRRIKITFSSGVVYNTSGGNFAYPSIWDGTVGSGTQLRINTIYAPANNAGAPISSVITTAPASGSKTYNIGLHTNAGTAGIEATATSPAFILVEAI